MTEERSVTCSDFAALWLSALHTITENTRYINKQRYIATCDKNSFAVCSTLYSGKIYSGSSVTPDISISLLDSNLDQAPDIEGGEWFCSAVGIII
jgi:hypothetical protein